MKIIVIVVVSVVAIFAIYRLISVKRQNKKVSAERFARVQVLYEKLESGQSVTERDVLPFVTNVLSRETVFQLLTDYNRMDAFPREFLTLEKGAESHLANWLIFPTELDACPDEMEHIKRVTFDFDGQNNLVHYEVFKYCVNEPHWAAKNGWMLGVVGPYFDESVPYDFPGATFSRVSSTVDNTTADDEAKWVHENISMRK